ncbi:MAG: DUF1905 domain-containing protein [Candidatus Levybacteria bacterium]|nr:DUF1905 domain-containing protein [Candidatus Levybacteria bacterium]
MKSNIFTIKSRLWEWEGKGSWHFVTIEKSDADEIKKDWPWPRKGFGSIPVSVTLGKSVWKTSIFPEKGGTYLLPIKKSVRITEEISKGNTLTFKLEVVS